MDIDVVLEVALGVFIAQLSANAVLGFVVTRLQKRQQAKLQEMATARLNEYRAAAEKAIRRAEAEGGSEASE